MQAGPPGDRQPPPAVGRLAHLQVLQRQERPGLRPRLLPQGLRAAHHQARELGAVAEKRHFRQRHR